LAFGQIEEVLEGNDALFAAAAAADVQAGFPVQGEAHG
jgi:hypothetical protein